MVNTLSKAFLSAAAAATILLGAQNVSAQEMKPFPNNPDGTLKTAVVAKKDTATTTTTTTTTYYRTPEAIRNVLQSNQIAAPSAALDSLVNDFEKAPSAFSFLSVAKDSARTTFDLVRDSVEVKPIPAMTVKRTLDASEFHNVTAGRYVAVIDDENRVKTQTFQGESYFILRQASAENDLGPFKKFARSDQHNVLGTKLAHLTNIVGNRPEAIKKAVIATYANLQDPISGAKGAKKEGYTLNPDAITFSGEGVIDDVIYTNGSDVNGRSLSKRKVSKSSTLTGHLLEFEQDNIFVRVADAMPKLESLASQQKFNKSTSIIIEYVQEAHQDTVIKKRELPNDAVIGDSAIIAAVAHADSLRHAAEMKRREQAKADSIAAAQRAASEKLREQELASAVPFPTGFGIRIGAYSIPAGNQVVLSGGLYSYSGKMLPAVGIDYATKPFLPFGIGLKGGVDVAFGKDIVTVYEDLGDMSGFTGNASGAFKGGVVKMHLEATKELLSNLRMSFGIGTTSYLGLLETKINLYDFAGNLVDAPQGARDGSVVNQITIFPRVGLEYNIGKIGPTSLILFGDACKEVKGSAHIGNQGIEGMVGVKFSGL